MIGNEHSTPRRLRVALFNPAGSAFGYTHSLAAALADAGADVTVLSGPHMAAARRDLPPSDYALEERFYARSWWRDRARAERGPVGRLAARAARTAEHAIGLAGVLRDAHRWDVVHTQWLPALPLDLPALVALRRRVPLVHTVHNVTPHDARDTAALRARWRAVYVLPHALIAHRADAIDALASLGVARERVHVIPHGNFAYLRAHASAAAPTPRDDAPEVLFFGQLAPYKGLDTLLAAMPIVLRAHPRARLRIVGRPRAPADLAAVHAQLDRTVAHAVDVDARYVPEADLPDLFARASLVALPYRAIQASGVAVTAATFGRPIVASDVGELGELVRAADCGRAVPPGDADALGAAIVDLLDDPERLRAMGERARAYADDVLGWDGIARAHLDAYAAARDRFARVSRPDPR